MTNNNNTKENTMLNRLIDCLSMWLLLLSMGTLAGIVYAGTCALLLGK